MKRTRTVLSPSSVANASGLEFKPAVVVKGKTFVITGKIRVVYGR
ncbi:MAG: hypothetical protein WC712_14495 [Candidatus Brocadiia bacterium]